jgi:hypothetical protein
MSLTVYYSSQSGKNKKFHLIIEAISYKFLTLRIINEFDLNLTTKRRLVMFRTTSDDSPIKNIQLLEQELAELYTAVGLNPNEDYYEKLLTFAQNIARNINSYIRERQPAILHLYLRELTSLPAYVNASNTMATLDKLALALENLHLYYAYTTFQIQQTTEKPPAIEVLGATAPQNMASSSGRTHKADQLIPKQRRLFGEIFFKKSQRFDTAVSQHGMEDITNLIIEIERKRKRKDKTKKNIEESISQILYFFLRSTITPHLHGVLEAARLGKGQLYIERLLSTMQFLVDSIQTSHLHLVKIHDRKIGIDALAIDILRHGLSDLSAEQYCLIETANKQYRPEKPLSFSPGSPRALPRENATHRIKHYCSFMNKALKQEEAAFEQSGEAGTASNTIALQTSFLDQVDRTAKGANTLRNLKEFLAQPKTIRENLLQLRKTITAAKTAVNRITKSLLSDKNHKAYRDLMALAKTLKAVDLSPFPDNIKSRIQLALNTINDIVSEYSISTSGSLSAKTPSVCYENIIRLGNELAAIDFSDLRMAGNFQNVAFRFPDTPPVVAHTPKTFYQLIDDLISTACVDLKLDRERYGDITTLEIFELYLKHANMDLLCDIQTRLPLYCLLSYMEHPVFDIAQQQMNVTSDLYFTPKPSQETKHLRFEAARLLKQRIQELNLQSSAYKSPDRDNENNMEQIHALHRFKLIANNPAWSTRGQSRFKLFGTVRKKAGAQSSHWTPGTIHSAKAALADLPDEFFAGSYVEARTANTVPSVSISTEEDSGSERSSSTARTGSFSFPSVGSDAEGDDDVFVARRADTIKGWNNHHQKEDPAQQSALSAKNIHSLQHGSEDYPSCRNSEVQPDTTGLTKKLNQCNQMTETVDAIFQRGNMPYGSRSCGAFAASFFGQRAASTTNDYAVLQKEATALAEKTNQMPGYHS